MCKWESLFCEKQVLCFFFLKDFCHLCCWWIWGGLQFASRICDLVVLRLFAWGIESKEKSPLAHDFPSPLITFNDDQRGGYWVLLSLIWRMVWMLYTMASEENEKEEIGERLRRNRVFLYKMQNNGQQKKNSSVLRLQTPREREKKTDRRIYLPITSDLHWVSSPPPPLRLLRRLLSSWESQPPEEFFRLFQKEFHWQLKLKVLTKSKVLLVGPPSFPSQLTLTSRSNLDLMGNILCFVQFLSLSFRVQNIP